MLDPIKTIQTVTAKHFGLTVEQLLMKSHSRAIARPRQVAMYFCHRMRPKASLPMIARRFGGLHHTTALWAEQRVAELIATDDEFAARIVEINAELEAAFAKDREEQSANRAEVDRLRIEEAARRMSARVA